MKNYKYTKGFTIVEMMVVIAVLGILATMTAFAFGSWKSTVAKNELKSDLLTVASAMESARNFSSGYPSAIPSTFSPSGDVVVEMTVATAGEYCINAYHVSQIDQRMSISSSSDQPQASLCSGIANGSTVGGAVPATPLGVNIAPDLSTWTRTGTASFNATTKVLTLGTNGTAVSPKTRVNGAPNIAIDGLFSATTMSAQAYLQPYGGWHIAIYYYGSDGVTPVANTIGYTGNGCAQKVTLGGGWNSGLSGPCTLPLGNGITYFSVTMFSSVGGYASTTLQYMQPSFQGY